MCFQKKKLFLSKTVDFQKWRGSFFSHIYKYLPWGGGSPCSKHYFWAKVKVFVFWNGQFSGHLIFYKKCFLVKKKIFSTPWTSTFGFLKKIIFLFLKKKRFFGEIFFRRIFYQNFSAHKKVLKFFRKQFPQKTFFFQKKTKIILKQKQKCLFIGVKKFFSPPKNFFCKTLSVR